jgi:HNH endonuclease
MQKGVPMANAEEKYAILISQRGCCIYCGKPLDGSTYRKGKIVELELQWDHAIPRALRIIDGEYNIVASCNICNQIKSDLIFDTVREARDWISERRRQKGYSDSKYEWYEEEHVEPGGMRCHRCGQRFSIVVSFKKHLAEEPRSCKDRVLKNQRRKEREEKWRIKSSREPKGNGICDICGGTFLNLTSHKRLSMLERHIAARNQELEESKPEEDTEEQVRKKILARKAWIADRIAAGEIPIPPRARRFRPGQPWAALRHSAEVVHGDGPRPP